MILKELKVLCFDTLLEVFILKVLRCVFFGHFLSVDSKWLTGGQLGDGEIASWQLKVESKRDGIGLRAWHG